jgi:hypothetical protein
MSEWPISRPVPAGTGRGAASRYLAVWLVTVQLSPAASAGKQPETANVITQTDRHSAAGMVVLAAPGSSGWPGVVVCANAASDGGWSPLIMWFSGRRALPSP